MFFRYIIFDLDDTIYNYTKCHNISINVIYELISKYTNIGVNDIKNIYTNIDDNHKALTINSASSHNKYIKFKHLLEKLNMTNVEEIHKKYWEIFYQNIKLNDGVLDLIIWLKSIGIKLYILTDYETEYQIEKLKQLNIFDYFDYILTSEEIGCEKPSIHCFNYIIMKTNSNKNEIIMIGDNFNKDIVGAINSGIYSYYYNVDFTKDIDNRDNYTEFSSFKLLYNYFLNVYIELLHLKTLSKTCGERFDLVQSGGGNTSVKVDNFMFIKSSGINLTDVKENTGYVMINNCNLLNDLSNNIVKNIVDYNVIGKQRGSIETYMHSVLKKYTLHLHPIQVNKILILKNSKNIIKELFPESLFIDYTTPGIKVYNEIKLNYKGEEIIFLDNHGLIITTNKYDNINYILNNVIDICDKYTQFDSYRYKFVNNISNYIIQKYNIDVVTYLSNDIIINKYIESNQKLFEEDITFPDALVYCGIKPLIGCIEDIDKYYLQYKEIPKILIIHNLLYIISTSLKKCKEIEDVLKANLLIIDTNQEKKYLSTDEIYFLNNWDAEKYRKTI